MIKYAYRDFNGKWQPPQEIELPQSPTDHEPVIRMDYPNSPFWIRPYPIEENHAIVLHLFVLNLPVETSYTTDSTGTYTTSHTALTATYTSTELQSTELHLMFNQRFGLFKPNVEGSVVPMFVFRKELKDQDAGVGIDPPAQVLIRESGWYTTANRYYLSADMASRAFEAQHPASRWTSDAPGGRSHVILLSRIDYPNSEVKLINSDPRRFVFDAGDEEFIVVPVFRSGGPPEYYFLRISSTAAQELFGRLFADGINALLDIGSQQVQETDFDATYHPGNDWDAYQDLEVAVFGPGRGLDFSPFGSMGIYYNEILLAFTVPSLSLQGEDQRRRPCFSSLPLRPTRLAPQPPHDSAPFP